MRFDDRLATILNFPARDAGAKAAMWVQIADLLAQKGEGLAPEQAELALLRLDAWRSAVPERRRLSVAAALSGRSLSPELVASFARDSALVAAPIIVRAKLDDAQWMRIIPDFPTTARALLRERKDLSPPLRAAISAYGPSDLALSDKSDPASHVVTAEANPAPMSVPIHELVRRIETFRERHPLGQPELPPKSVSLSSFAFETDSAGLFSWVEGAPRGPLIGISLAELALPGGYGVDGQASGPFRKRSPIRDARLRVAGHGPASGEWMLTAQPFFEPSSGRFQGYRGVARRVRPNAASDLARAGLFGPHMQPDSMRQLIHELRTPLNAIRGFSEMIEGQFLGPVDIAYRDRATGIVAESGKLLRIFEDIDAAARPEPPENGAQRECNLNQIVASTAGLHAQLAETGNVRLQVALPEKPLIARIDDLAAGRLTDRLVQLCLATAARGETLKLVLQRGDSQAEIAITRPKSLRSVPDEVLLDPTFAPHNRVLAEEVPLGLPFALRLLQHLAARRGGQFILLEDRFVLRLPQEQDSDRESMKGG